MEWRQSGDRYVEALRTITGAALGPGDGTEYGAAAAALDDAAGSGELPRGHEFYATACSALCCDMAGMRADAVRMCGLLERRCAGEFECIVRSPEHTGRLVRGLASLGMGDGGRLPSVAVDGAVEWMLSQAPPGGPVEHDAPDDYNVIMATAHPPCEFYESLGGPGSDGRAREPAKRAGMFDDDLLHYYPDPPLGFMASLCLRLIEAADEHSMAGGPALPAAAPGRPVQAWPARACRAWAGCCSSGMPGRAGLACRPPAGLFDGRTGRPRGPPDPALASAPAGGAGLGADLEERARHPCACNTAQAPGKPALHGAAAGASKPAALHLAAPNGPEGAGRRIPVMAARATGLPVLCTRWRLFLRGAGPAARGRQGIAPCLGMIEPTRLVARHAARGRQGIAPCLGGGAPVTARPARRGWQTVPGRRIPGDCALHGAPGGAPGRSRTSR